MSGGALFGVYDEMARQDDLPKPDEAGLKRLSGLRQLSWASPNGGAEVEMQMALDLLPEPLRAQAQAAFERALPLCESPIERRLLPWLLCQPYSCFETFPCALMPGESADLKPYTVAVVPQLAIGRRRADFALAARRGGPVRFVIVECDGAAFHENVHDDVRRDQDLMRYNRVLDVHPLTGREIWRNAEAAAATASQALTHAWSRMNKRTASKFGGAA